MRWTEGIKRLLDLVISSLCLILLSPVLTVVAAAVMVDLGWPILFRQERTGKDGATFQLVKFRTMKPGTGRDWADDEARLTAFGRFLRSTSLDELPTLWNVLTGDMSLVGPRPLPAFYDARYTERQRRRHLVRPGITGWSQIHGRNALSWERKFELDVWYVENRSLRLDLVIFARTLPAVVSRRGVSAEAHPTMPEFLPDQPETQA